MEKIKIVVAGPRGRMGKEAVFLVNQTEHFELVAVIDRKNNGGNLKDCSDFQSISAPIYTDINECFQQVKADVLIDLTTPEYGMQHTVAALENGVRPVVGTTGFSSGDLKKLEDMCKNTGLGCIIAPNFALGPI